MFGIAREAQVPAILDAYEIPCVFSDALVNALTLHKGMTKRVIRDLGLATPDFAVIETPADIARVKLALSAIRQARRRRHRQGIDSRNKIKTARRIGCHLPPDCSLDYRQPVLVETYLSGREFTVGIVGTGEKARSVGTVEIVLPDSAEPDVYSYVNKEECEERVRLRPRARRNGRRGRGTLAGRLRGLGCRDGGRVDVRADANGVMNFLEVNPLAGLHPEHSDLPIICTKAGISYVELIRMIVDSAIERVTPRGTAPLAFVTLTPALSLPGRGSRTARHRRQLRTALPDESRSPARGGLCRCQA